MPHEPARCVPPEFWCAEFLRYLQLDLPIKTDASENMIDTHLHFWDLATYATSSYTWLAAHPAICRNFLPPDLKPHFDACGVQSGVIVEAAHDSHDLNRWWLALAEQYAYIGAAVLGCTLEQENLAAWFDEYSHSPYFVGVRTAPAGPPEQWLENAATAHGLHELVRRDLSLDLLVGYASFPAVGALAARYPTLRIILDHCAHPPFRENQLDAWAKALAPLAVYPNIHIKYSSFLLYTYPDSAPARLRPVAEFLLETFGIPRLIWGSNWPVELLGGTYAEALHTMQTCIGPLTEAETAALYHDNAAAFYRVHSIELTGGREGWGGGEKLFSMKTASSRPSAVHAPTALG